MKSCDALVANMIAYRDLYNMMEGEFEGCELGHIGRESNEEADMLANLGSTKSQIPPGIFLERIEHRSIITKQTTPESLAQAKEKAPTAEDLPVKVYLAEQHGHIPSWHTYSEASYQRT